MRRYFLLPLALLLLPTATPAQSQSTPRLAPEALHRIAPKTPGDTRALFRPTGRPLPFVDAHRGGSLPGYPENCIETFENTLQHTFAIMEVDPRRTKDGAFVLMHDETLDRTTNGSGRVADHTLAQLKALRLKDRDGNVTPYTIPTLDEALQWARGKTILVLDSKDVSAADRARTITQNNAEAHAMVIAYNTDDIKACHDLNPDIMMEVILPNPARIRAFEQLGIPWSHVIVFVSHNPSKDPSIYKNFHDRGAATMVGTSRTLDRELLTGKIANLKPLEAEYRALMDAGVDLIETDIPTHLGPLLHGHAKIPEGMPLIPPSAPPEGASGADPGSAAARPIPGQTHPA